MHEGWPQSSGHSFSASPLGRLANPASGFGARERDARLDERKH
jgi:hypothetical protein